MKNEHGFLEKLALWIWDMTDWQWAFDWFVRESSKRLLRKYHLA
jgi:hypothetical protein